MKIFKINEDISIVCSWVSTRNGFKHTANLIVNGSDVLETEISYLNRTWESYEYESVINKLKELATKEAIINFKELETESKI